MSKCAEILTMEALRRPKRSQPMLGFDHHLIIVCKGEKYLIDISISLANLFVQVAILLFGKNSYQMQVKEKSFKTI